jgi:TolA-binding protein
MSSVARAYVAATILLLPTLAFSQDGFYIQGRLDGLQRQLADLAARVEQLRAEDQQLQQRLESMRTKFEARLERLEGKSR